MFFFLFLFILPTFFCVPSEQSGDQTYKLITDVNKIKGMFCENGMLGRYLYANGRQVGVRCKVSGR